MPNTLLNDGYQGKDGSVEINVAMRNGASLGYADRYRLVVDDFDVIDEGVDGIYEPGEFLKVTNITVRNEGERHALAMFLQLRHDASKVQCHHRLVNSYALLSGNPRGLILIQPTRSLYRTQS